MIDEIQETVVRENSEKHKVRMLNFSLGATPKFEEVDGGLMVRDVLALDEGQWTDSAVGTPLYYTPKALSESVGNWKATGFWNRHSGGMPRALTDKVGRVINPRFLNTGMYVDIFLHKRTQASRDMADMISSGEATLMRIAEKSSLLVSGRSYTRSIAKPKALSSFTSTLKDAGKFGSRIGSPRIIDS